MSTRRLLNLLLLLPLLVTGTYLTRAAASASPPRVTPPPGGPVEPGELQRLIATAREFEAFFAVDADGTWSGRIRILSGSSAPMPSHEVASEENRGASGTFLTEGEDLGQLTGAVFYGEDTTRLVARPAVVELSGPVHQDQDLMITLPSNPSTGYSWAVTTPGEGSLLQIGGVETRQISQGLGTPARQTIRFRALDTTAVQLRLTYRRPWEASALPRRVISIRANDVDLAEVLSALSLPPSAPVAPFLRSAERIESTSQPTDDSIASPSALPSSFNWCDQGACTPVKDQGSCGSCWAFATVGPLESNILIEHSTTTNLSEQYLLSCNTDGFNCDGGWWAHDYHWNYAPGVETEPGAVLEADFGYAETDTVACAGPYAHHYRILSWDYVDSDQWPSTEAIKQAIYDYGPVSAAVCVGEEFGSYSGGVFETDESEVCDGYVNHAIVLVGWDDSAGTSGAWILRNSWGSSWADGGYMRIGYGISNVGYSANYVVYFTPSDRAYLPLVMQASGSPPQETVTSRTAATALGASTQAKVGLSSCTRTTCR